MAVLWLVVWWAAASPPAFVGPSWNSWGIALIACVAIDMITALVWARRELTRPEVDRAWKPEIG